LLDRANDITFNECNFHNNIVFERLEFKGLFLLENCTFEQNLTFQNIIFQNTTSFILSKVKNETKYIHTKFQSLALFSEFKSKELIFDNTFFKDESNFLDIKIDKLSRETARIIKNSFEQQNNIIEANKFYALEMKEREKELNKDRKEGKNLLEWLVFKIHGLASNHSQDWLLSLFWILSFSFGYGFINCINNYLDTKLEFILIDIFVYLIIIVISVLVVQNEKINNYYLIGVFYLIYGFTSKDFNLYDISNNINPFSIMTGWQELSFLTLSYKIIIAYLIYQLIISIRQNTRRK